MENKWQRDALRRAAGSGATSQVRISAEVGEGGLTQSVEDDGPGISPEQATAAARGGERLDVMVLGLSVVADLVDDAQSPVIKRKR